LCRSGGKVRALSGKCPHYGAPLAKGDLRDGRIVCPWHGSCFNAETGDIHVLIVLVLSSSYVMLSTNVLLKVHKREIFYGSDFEFFTIS
jgi:hypothetical protein